MLMGTMFDAAFQRFAAAFEKRADVVYGKPVRDQRRRKCLHCPAADAAA